ncbi:UNVERIFIED_CONTAM: hypothetical protein GTU68_047497 [Idotea baltica]|nr:hypothetical protein [Idotea baltica]
MKIDGSLMFDPITVGPMATELEGAGFDGAYTFEGQSDPFISIAAAAMTTEKMELMTAIAVAFARNPMSLAYLGNDLQNLSQGRFILGLGSQIKAHIERRFSMPWSKPAARMREMVLAIKAIWRSWETGERLNFEDEFYSHTLQNPMLTPPANPFGSPRIFVAGVGPLMTKVAAEVSDGYFMHPFNTARSMDELSLVAISDGLSLAGKSRDNFEISAQVITATGLDEESLQAAIFSAKSQIAFYSSTPAYAPVLKCHGWEGVQLEANRLSKEGKWMEMSELVTDEMLETFAAVGTPEKVAEQIAQRFKGKVDRISPVVYQPDMALMAKLRQEIAARCS